MWRKLHQQRSARSPISRRRLAFEPLEPRILLSADLAPMDGVLSIAGTDGDDFLLLRELEPAPGAAPALLVVLNNDSFEVSLEGIKAIEVALGDGGDSMVLEGANALPAVQIDLGEGDNDLSAVLRNPSGVLEVLAGSGNDTVDAQADWTGSSVDDHPDFLWAPRINTGAGNDVVDFSAVMGIEPQPFLPHVKLEAVIDTGGGNDVLDLDSVTGGGSSDAVYRVRMGDGDNDTSIRFGDGVNGARLPSGESNVRAEYRSGAGADTVSVKYTMFLADGTPVRARALDLDILTGGGDDTVEFEAGQADPTDPVPAAALDLAVKLDTGDGDDTTRSNVFGIWMTTGYFEVDMGAGDDRLAVNTSGVVLAEGAKVEWLYDLGAGDDDGTHIRANWEIDAGVDYRWAVALGEGDDTFKASVKDQSVGEGATVAYEFSGGAGGDEIGIALTDLTLAESAAFAMKTDAGDGDDLVAHEIANIVQQAGDSPPDDDKPVEFQVYGGAGLDRLMVSVGGTDPVTASFKSVSGQDSETEVIDFKQGTDLPLRKKPGRIEMGGLDEVTLETGLGADRIRIEIEDPAAPVPALTVRTGGGDDTVSANYDFRRAWPVKWQGPSLDVDTGAGDDVVDVGVFMGVEPEPFLPVVDLGIRTGDGDDSVRAALLLPAVQSAREAANRMRLELGSGNDDASVDIAAGLTPCCDIGIDAGLGDDKVLVNVSGSPEEILIGLLLGGGNDVAEINIDTTSVAAGVVPCIVVGVDGGLGGDQVSVDARGVFEEFDLSVNLGADATGNDIPIETLSLNFEKIDKATDDTASCWIRTSQLALGGGMSLSLGAGGSPSTLALDVQGSEGEDFAQARILGFADVSVNVEGRGGNDSIWLDLGAPVMVEEPVTRRLSLSGGEGDDNVRASIHDGTSNTIFVAEAYGGAGNDVLDVALSGESAGMELLIDAGDGDDAVMFNPTEFTLDKSVVWKARVDAGDGDDRLSVDTSGVRLGAQSRVEWLYDMGAGDDDVTHIRANWEIGASVDYRWAVNLGEGDDAFKASVDRQTVGDAASVAYKFSGGGGDDEIEVALENLALGDGAAFTMNTDAGDGDDLVRHEVAHVVQQTGGKPPPDDIKPAEFKVDTGSGRDTLIVSMGGAAPVTASFKNVEGLDSETEVVEFREGDDADVRKKPGRIALKGVEALTLVTGAGDDHIRVEVTDPAVPPPDLTIDTGAGDDTVHASWNFENAWPAKWSGPVMKSSAGAGDDLVSIGIDTTGVAAGIQPCVEIAVDAGLGGDRVGIDAVGVFGKFDLSVDLGADASGDDIPTETLSLNFEELKSHYSTQSTHHYTPKGGSGVQAEYHVGIRSDGELVQAVQDVETIGGLVADQVNVEIGENRTETVGANLTVANSGGGTTAARNALAVSYTLVAELDGADGATVDGDVKFEGGAGDNKLAIDLSKNDASTHAGFANVTGLSSEITPAEYRTGGEIGEDLKLTIDVSGVDALDLLTGDADDEIDLDLVYPTVPIPKLTIKSGRGNDSVGGTLLGVAGALDITLDTGDGDDHVALDYTEAAALVTGAGMGGLPQVKAFSGASSVEGHNFLAYDPQFTGGVRVAVGDVNGDGVQDIVTGAGPGGGPHVKVFDGRTGAELRSFFAYDPGFTGGVYVAAGDVNGDGFADIVTGADAGGGPHVRVFSGDTGAELRSFFAYSPDFLGGVRVATGDVNNDGFDDIITGAGPGGGPHVRVFDGLTGAATRGFFAYDPAFLGGVFVAAGDVDGDGFDDIITGAGAGGGPHVKVFSGANSAELRSFFAYTPSFTGGVRVAAGDVNGDGLADIVTGAGPGAGPHVKVFDGSTGAEVRSFFAYDPSFMGGVYVAAGDVNSDAPGTFDLAVNTGGGNDEVVLDFATGGSRSDRIDAELGDGADRFELRWSGALQEPSVDLQVDVHVDPGGTGFLPEVADEVLVSFEHGDPDRPLVIGSVWNSKDQPPPDDETPPPDDQHLLMSLASTDGVLSSSTEILGGAGTDEVTYFASGRLNAATAGPVSAEIDLGDGADSMTIDFTGLEMEGPKKLAPISLDLRGGDGRDTLAIIGTEGNDKFTLTGRSVLLEGAANASFAGFEAVQVYALGGNDEVMMSGFEPRIDWRIDGGAGHDRFLADFEFDRNPMLVNFEKVKVKKPEKAS